MFSLGLIPQSDTGLPAQVVVTNLIDLLTRHGFVPNGSRTYYLNRRCSKDCLTCVLCCYILAKGHTAVVKIADVCSSTPHAPQSQ